VNAARNGLRSLNMPSPIWVRADADGRPRSVRRRDWPEPRRVAKVQDRWRIDDEWWREQPLSRMYYVLRLEDETVVTVYHDMVKDRWYEQRG
jgi:hypothetical protein